MQLTREYGHRSQHGFSGALAGTLEEARRYWDPLPHEERAKQENIDTFMNLRYAKESTSQSSEASSQHEQGEQGEQRALTRKDFLSEYEYRNHLAQTKGFDNYYQYQKHKAKEKGFETFDAYKNHKAQEKGFKSHYEYKNRRVKRGKDS